MTINLSEHENSKLYKLNISRQASYPQFHLNLFADVHSHFAKNNYCNVCLLLDRHYYNTLSTCYFSINRVVNTCLKFIRSLPATAACGYLCITRSPGSRHSRCTRKRTLRRRVSSSWQQKVYHASRISRKFTLSLCFTGQNSSILKTTEKKHSERVTGMAEKELISLNFHCLDLHNRFLIDIKVITYCSK